MMLKTIATICMLGALVMGVFIGFLVNEAYAEETIINAKNADKSILIAFDGDLSYILYETPQGISQHYDGKLKVYNSGGFSLKSYETGIAVWGHFNGASYDLFVLTTEGVDRFTGHISVKKIVVVEKEPIDESNDILKGYWENRAKDSTRPAEVEKKFVLDLDYMEHNSIFVGDEYTPTIKTSDRGDHIGVPSVEVIIEISRNGDLLQQLTGTTDRFGKWNPAYKILYPPFIPSFCYQVEITANYLNHTATETDDFLVITNAKYWKSNTGEYTVEPRNIPQDYNCND